MLKEGQVVECVDDKMDGIGPGLDKGKKYTVKEFISIENCKILFFNHLAEWYRNGGRVELKEMPGCYWYGRRFEVR